MSDFLALKTKQTSQILQKNIATMCFLQNAIASNLLEYFYFMDCEKENNCFFANAKPTAEKLGGLSRYKFKKARSILKEKGFVDWKIDQKAGNVTAYYFNVAKYNEVAGITESAECEKKDAVSETAKNYETKQNNDAFCNNYSEKNAINSFGATRNNPSFASFHDVWKAAELDRNNHDFGRKHFEKAMKELEFYGIKRFQAFQALKNYATFYQINKSWKKFPYFFNKLMRKGVIEEWFGESYYETEYYKKNVKNEKKSDVSEVFRSSSVDRQVFQQSSGATENNIRVANWICPSCQSENEVRFGYCKCGYSREKGRMLSGEEKRELKAIYKENVRKTIGMFTIWDLSGFPDFLDFVKGDEDFRFVDASFKIGSLNEVQKEKFIDWYVDQSNFLR